MILLALAASEDLSEHEVREHALVFLADAKITLSAGRQRETLAAPALVHLELSERHAVHAHGDAGS